MLRPLADSVLGTERISAASPPIRQEELPEIHSAVSLGQQLHRMSWMIHVSWTWGEQKWAFDQNCWARLLRDPKEKCMLSVGKLKVQ